MFCQYDTVSPEDDTPGGLEPTPYELACHAYYQERELERQVKKHGEDALRGGLPAKTEDGAVRSLQIRRSVRRSVAACISRRHMPISADLRSPSPPGWTPRSGRRLRTYSTYGTGTVVEDCKPVRQRLHRLAKPGGDPSVVLRRWINQDQ